MQGSGVKYLTQSVWPTSGSALPSSRVFDSLERRSGAWMHTASYLGRTEYSSGEALFFMRSCSQERCETIKIDYCTYSSAT